ncbi:hypothetical protein HK104_003238, partial [Borealophlyctis nickersoniae]
MTTTPPTTTSTPRKHTKKPPKTPSPHQTQNQQQQQNLSYEERTLAVSILNQMQRHSDAGPFLFPIPRWRLPDYDRVVKHPMDLSTVQQRLKKDGYGSVWDVVEDLRTMLENCFCYYPPNSQTHQMGRRLEQAFNFQVKRIPSYLASLHLPTSTQPRENRKRSTPPSSSPSSKRRRVDAADGAQETRGGKPRKNISIRIGLNGKRSSSSSSSSSASASV